MCIRVVHFESVSHEPAPVFAIWTACCDCILSEKWERSRGWPHSETAPTNSRRLPHGRSATPIDHPLKWRVNHRDRDGTTFTLQCRTASDRTVITPVVRRRAEVNARQVVRKSSSFRRYPYCRASRLRNRPVDRQDSFVYGEPGYDEYRARLLFSYTYHVKHAAN